MHTGFWREDLWEGDHKEDVSIGGGDDIKMGLREVGWRSMDWIDLALSRDSGRRL